MPAFQQVLHRSPRAISIPEFYDAVRATCKPRFPHARGFQFRHVGLAISGGVDSMALAYLCSRIRRYDPEIKITDNPCCGFRAVVVNHHLRDGSTEEAAAVRTALRKMGILTEVMPIKWKRELGESADVRSLSNLESVARRARYRTLGRALSYRQIATILLAHHQDDQYETVLMRLLLGHRNRGLCGMRKAAGIPECEGIFKAYNSGWVDDQNQQFPFYNTKLTRNQTRYLKQDLRYSITQLKLEENPDENRFADLDKFSHEDYDNWVGGAPMKFDVSANLASMPVEDGGINIYRPLLEFSKDRLIATCVENNVPWWEDHTNKDPTLTLRNAVRHMHKSCQLPRALQKPAVLALSERCQRRARAEDAEVYRLLQRTVLHEFEPHVGSLVVQFPKLSSLTSERPWSSNKRLHRRILQKRIIAGLLLQKIMNIVSPELQVPSLPNLQNAISRLFPSLALPTDSVVISPAKAFAIAGLHFMPIESTPRSVTSSVSILPRTWYVSRQPYTSNMPLPTLRVPYWSVLSEEEKQRRQGNARWKWSDWLPWHFWDGRFWIRITHRLPYRVVIMPFMIEHAKPFRDSLSPDDRDRLATYLKKFAPGKVRYTLPGIYSEEYLDLENMEPRSGYPCPKDGVVPDISARGKERQPVLPIRPSELRLLALPTMDIGIPGLSKWLLHEARYKRVDRETLAAAGSFTRGSFTALASYRRKLSHALAKEGPRKARLQRCFAKKRQTTIA